MNDKFYFQHDYNARNDQKLLELRAEHGAEGYGIWWMIAETLAEQDGIDSHAIGGLSLGFGVAKSKLEEVIETCTSLGLLYEKDGVLRNKRMDDHKKFRKKLSKAGKKGAQNRWNSTPGNGESDGDGNSPADSPLNSPANGPANGPPNGDRMAKERKGKESKGKENTTQGGKQSLPLSQKREKFWAKIKRIGDDLGAPEESLQAFFRYWAEHNDNGFKLKCEKQPTFNTKQRLQTWLKKEQDFKRSNSEITMTEDQYMAMSLEKRKQYEHPLKMWGVDRKPKIVERPGEAPKPLSDE